MRGIDPRDVAPPVVGARLNAHVVVRPRPPQLEIGQQAADRPSSARLPQSEPALAVERRRPSTARQRHPCPPITAPTASAVAPVATPPTTPRIALFEQLQRFARDAAADGCMAVQRHRVFFRNSPSPTAAAASEHASRTFAAYRLTPTQEDITRRVDDDVINSALRAFDATRLQPSLVKTCTAATPRVIDAVRATHHGAQVSATARSTMKAKCRPASACSSTRVHSMAVNRLRLNADVQLATLLPSGAQSGLSPRASPRQSPRASPRRDGSPTPAASSIPPRVRAGNEPAKSNDVRPEATVHVKLPRPPAVADVLAARDRVTRSLREASETREAFTCRRRTFADAAAARRVVIEAAALERMMQQEAATESTVDRARNNREQRYRKRSPSPPNVVGLEQPAASMSR
jgi:hypothetical protein